MKIRRVSYVNQFGMETDEILQFLNEKEEWETVPLVKIYIMAKTRHDHDPKMSIDKKR